MKPYKTWLPSSLYLANLLVLPLFSYLMLFWLFINAKKYDELFQFHVKASFWLATFSGVVLIGIPLITLIIGQFSDLAWMFALTFLVTTHGFLVVAGVFMLAKGMNEQTFWFPFLNDLR